MYESKINLIMALPGRVIMSEQECLRKVRRPLMGKGKKANKQVLDKNGNPVWVTVKEPDPMKNDRDIINLTGKDGTKETFVIFTRKARPASKSLNLSEESYNYFVSDECPEGFHAPRNFKPKVSPFRKSVNLQAWLAMSKEDRLKWHLNSICESMGGTLTFYSVHGD